MEISKAEMVSAAAAAPGSKGAEVLGAEILVRSLIEEQVQ